ncbi:MAG: putative toxin-antitoxin system toxin component, PIN family [Burkholderiales bacterium]
MIVATAVEPALETFKLVLDTNVVLDLLLFDDPRVRCLAEGIAATRLSVVTDAHCTEELRRVLRYANFALSDATQAALLHRYLGFAHDVEGRPAATHHLRCSDPDDQKFLDLAWTTEAHLLTRDNALLSIGKRYAAKRGKRITTPDIFFAGTA